LVAFTDVFPIDDLFVVVVLVFVDCLVVDSLVVDFFVVLLLVAVFIVVLDFNRPLTVTLPVGAGVVPGGTLIVELECVAG